jgi:hypothetical protein
VANSSAAIRDLLLLEITRTCLPLRCSSSTIVEEYSTIVEEESSASSSQRCKVRVNQREWEMLFFAVQHDEKE